MSEEQGEATIFSDEFADNMAAFVDHGAHKRFLAAGRDAQNFSASARAGAKRAEGSLSAPDSFGTSSLPARFAVTKWARECAISDGICRQATRLYTDHAIGSGMRVEVVGDVDREDKDGKDPRREKAQKIVDAMWASPWNVRQLGFQGQRRASDRLFTAGERFDSLVGAKNSDLTLRWVDGLQITATERNPEDSDEIWLWLKRMCDSAGKVTWRAYWDIYANQEKAKAALKIVGDTLPKIEVGYESAKEVPIQKDTVLHQVLTNTLDDRGNSMLTGVLGWAYLYRRFGASRAALQQALARMLFDDKVKGGATAVNAHAAQEDSSLSPTNSTESNPPHAYGSTFAHNAGIERTVIKQETAASDATKDGGMLLKNAAMAVGLFPIFFGDGEMQRMATSGDMVPAMRKAFEAYQRTHANSYKVIAERALGLKGFEPGEVTVTVVAPPITDDDVKAMMAAMASLLNSLPVLKEADEILKIAADLLGAEDAEKLVKALAERVLPENDDPAPVSEEMAERNMLLNLSAAVGDMAGALDTDGLNDRALAQMEAAALGEDEGDGGEGGRDE